MANSSLFRSLAGSLIPAALSRNEAGGVAYARTPRQALAQYAATGCLNTTFYADAEEQLQKVLELCGEVEAPFVAKTAVYCREQGHMKDMPALLVAALARRDVELMSRVFDRVIDSPRMLRTFVQIVRSGVTGRKSFGSCPKRCVRRWLDRRSDEAVFAASVGNAPSLCDILRMVHPRPTTPSREALYGYLLGRSFESEALPQVVRQYEAFKAGETLEVPNVPFQMLTALGLSAREWTQIARNGSWQMVRMNLNTFARHGVFDSVETALAVAERLRDEEAIRKARVFPYQLLSAWRAADGAVPKVVIDALEDAMELAIANVPAVEGQVYVCPDVSGSMQSPVTGYRSGATSAVRCVDVAALMAAAILRRNPQSEVLPFEQWVVPLRLSARDSVMTNAQKLAAVGGGGTCVSAPLAKLNASGAKGELVVIVSDNQSWADGAGRGTATLREWGVFRRRNPSARLVLVDIQPGATTQASAREDILNVGGFSDQVFDVVAAFAAGRFCGDHWVAAIDSVSV